MEGGGRGTLENVQNVLLHASHLSVVLTQSPDVNQNKAITSSTDDAHSDAYCQRDSLCAYFLTDLCLTVRSSFVCFLEQVRGRNLSLSCHHSVAGRRFRQTKQVLAGKLL